MAVSNRCRKLMAKQPEVGDDGSVNQCRCVRGVRN